MAPAELRERSRGTRKGCVVCTLKIRLALKCLRLSSSGQPTALGTSVPQPRLTTETDCWNSLENSVVWSVFSGDVTTLVVVEDGICISLIKKYGPRHHTNYMSLPTLQLPCDLLWVWHLQDVSSSDLLLVHQLVHLRQILQVDRLEGCMDQASCKEVNCLLAVLAVSDVLAWMRTILSTDSKTGASILAPAGRPMTTTVPRGRTYSAACVNGFEVTATRMTA